MLESNCGWEKLDNRRGFYSDRQRLISATCCRPRGRRTKTEVGPIQTWPSSWYQVHVMTTLACSVQPIPTEEAFVATHPSRGILHLGWGVESCPVGLNVDGVIIFDMRGDRRVMGIEIFARVGGTLLSPRVARKIADAKFHSLFLTRANGSLSAADAGLKLQHKGADWIGWTFGPVESPTRYWLGGGGFADVERGALVGIGLQFQA